MRLFAAITGCFFIWLFLVDCNQQPSVSAKTEQQQLITTGRYLFYDRRLSVNNTKSCGTCHAQEFSFTDSYVRSIGALGDLHQRNAKPLINLFYNTYFTSSDSSIKTLEQQMNRPMFNTHPVEMGIKGNEEAVLKKIKSDTLYQRLFHQCFPKQSNPFTFENIKKAIVAFEQTITSFNSSYDKFLAGDSNALSLQEKGGMQLFFSNKLNCNNCHGGKNFNTPTITDTNSYINFYHNTGLYGNNYPALDEGLFVTTNNVKDKWKFKVPTLRNLAFTAPYYHDGSGLTLNDVVHAYEDGGRSIVVNGFVSDGKTNVYKSTLIKGFTLTLQQRKALISFLFSLSDSSVLTNPAYANPFTDDETKQ